ncbi:response regulator [Desulfomarina sp.]
MTESHIGPGETHTSMLEYLKSLKLLRSNLDLKIKNNGCLGELQIRGGEIAAGRCGELVGNGAVLTLAGLGSAEITSLANEDSPKKNVSFLFTQIERLLHHFSKTASGENRLNEKKLLDEAIAHLYQFQRKEAGTKLVKILRANRFFYPAWLWHSRLMTREDYIQKALNEAGKWGNADNEISREIEKITPQISGRSATVRRCFFCWSLVRPGEKRCCRCGGFLRISKTSFERIDASGELEEVLPVYEKAFRGNPGNARIAYCLALAYFSLENMERAGQYINLALEVVPKEPLLLRAGSVLSGQTGRNRKTQKTQKTRKIPNKTPAPPLKSGVAETEKSSGKVILVVEDSRTSRKVISMLLSRKGHEIIEATTGEEALTRVLEKVPDLVLLDVMLPDMTGYEILPLLRKDVANVPVVMLTGKKSSADRLKGMKSGASEYLTKPFDPARLISVVDRYLESKITQKQKDKNGGVKNGAKPVFSAKKTEKTLSVQEKQTGKNGKTILVVEDSPTSRKVISMVLSKRGYGVEEAADGFEALNKMTAAVPDLVLLDAILPDITGYELLPKLQNIVGEKAVPVVMLTGKKRSVDRERGLRAGSVAYLTKPFNPENLLKVIDNHVG